MTLREGLAITASPMVPTAFGPCLLRDRFHRQHDFRQRRQRVAAQRHRRRAGMAFEAGDLAVVPQHALAGIDHADGLVLGFEDRALFDVQLDEAGEFLRADRAVAAIADAVERLATVTPSASLRDRMSSVVKSPT